MPQPKTPKLSSILPGDISTYPQNTVITNYARLSHIPSMGLGLTATQDLPAGTTWYLATVDNYLPIPRRTFTAIRQASKKHPEWENFKKSIEMCAVYSERWDSVNFSLDNLRFLNHGIVERGQKEEEEEEVMGNVDIGGTAVTEDTMVGWSAWTTRDVKEGEQLVVNYLKFKHCPWANSCTRFLMPDGDEEIDFEALDKETVCEEGTSNVEILLTREQLGVYVDSGLERDIDKALMMVVAKWAVWDEGRGVFVIKVPFEN
ncbi:hypothetical protein TWF225_008123 [Orbilia oligospora]|uniref:SET domain-containing protein n=1 Tax=Orbilia oligospora TaxID=2813651 RepID=A0A8H2DZH3_ORBOL|nr:hypothetical protein TWF225_008123 [Orbilia oligospora]KAF3261338.1 hypothetical protein TWF128_003114 [Orbilia oligospora]KAF3268829.1 hypothetical protein TWF217_010126 [Orbilia oligospora]KAF3293292.1 hypothetical protein TWF132_004932 [Orbilia oligospora]TGJ67823.1 hypothetical protein EYR41_006925 [Orbilia oligospora]